MPSTQSRRRDPGNMALEELLIYLDRLEELREDMVDLAITSIDEIEQRIASLSARIDDHDQASDSS